MSSCFGHEAPEGSVMAEPTAENLETRLEETSSFFPPFLKLQALYFTNVPTLGMVLLLSS